MYADTQWSMAVFSMFKGYFFMAVLSFMLSSEFSVCVLTEHYSATRSVRVKFTKISPKAPVIYFGLLA